MMQRRGQVWYIIGVAGCGKSTVAKALARQAGGVFLEGDEFHPDENVSAMRAGIPLTDEMRWPWLERLASAAADHAADGQKVFVACSGLRRSYRDVLRAKFSPCQMIYLGGSKELILGRMRMREGHYMPTSLLDSQFDTLESPLRDEKGIISLDISPSIETVIENASRIAFDGNEGLAPSNPTQ